MNKYCKLIKLFVVSSLSWSILHKTLSFGAYESSNGCLGCRLAVKEHSWGCRRIPLSGESAGKSIRGLVLKVTSYSELTIALLGTILPLERADSN